MIERIAKILQLVASACSLAEYLFLKDLREQVEEEERKNVAK